MCFQKQLFGFHPKPTVLGVSWKKVEYSFEQNENLFRSKDIRNAFLSRLPSWLRRLGRGGEVQSPAQPPGVEQRLGTYPGLLLEPPHPFLHHLLPTTNAYGSFYQATPPNEI